MQTDLHTTHTDTLTRTHTHRHPHTHSHLVRVVRARCSIINWQHARKCFPSPHVRPAAPCHMPHPPFWAFCLPSCRAKDSKWRHCTWNYSKKRKQKSNRLTTCLSRYPSRSLPLLVSLFFSFSPSLSHTLSLSRFLLPSLPFLYIFPSQIKCKQFNLVLCSQSILSLLTSTCLPRPLHPTPESQLLVKVAEKHLSMHCKLSNWGNFQKKLLFGLPEHF